MLRERKNNPDLTSNDLIDYVKSIPTKSEIDSYKPPVIKEPTPSGERIVRPSGVSKPPEPVGKGEERLSRAYQRVKDTVVASEGDPTYRQMNLEEDAKRAVDLTARDFEGTVAALRGRRRLPSGVTFNSLASAAADEAAQRGNFGLQAELETRRTLALTRGGQEIASNRSINDGTPSAIIDNLIKDRMEAVKSRLKGRTVTQAIASEVADVKSKVSISAPKIAEFHSFIESITC